MTAPIPRGHTAVMANRAEPPDSLDLFPTPPWATRALCEHVISPEDMRRLIVWEPAAGMGHMSGPLAEYFAAVAVSDVFDYGLGHQIGSFVGEGADVIQGQTADWIITNPPFKLADDFAERAVEIATRGVALLVRSVWAEGGDRYRRLFSVRPPTIIAQFVERVPMTKGRWDPTATTATSYAWFVWAKKACLVGDQLPGEMLRGTRFVWIPPGCRKRLTKADDAARFAGASA